MSLRPLGADRSSCEQLCKFTKGRSVSGLTGRAVHLWSVDGIEDEIRSSLRLNQLRQWLPPSGYVHRGDEEDRLQQWTRTCRCHFST